MPSHKSKISPGTVLILLAGKHKGKRVIYLGPHNCSKNKDINNPPSNKSTIKMNHKRASASNKTLFLVTGPYFINGVPLRRVDPRYTIATSMEIDMSFMDSQMETVLKQIPSSYFAPSKKEKYQMIKKVKKNTQSTDKDGLFVEPTKESIQSTMAEWRKQMNSSETGMKIKAVEKELNMNITKVIKDNDMLKRYMKSMFSLRKNEFPHNMKF